MAKKVTVNNLQDAIKDILDEYSDQVYENLEEITQRIGKKGVEAVRNSSKEAFNGKVYASGWGMTVEKNRLYTSVIIHNKKQAGLAHLLEHGHVKANGTGRYGQWDGVEHLLPVEEKLVDEFESEVVSKL